MTNKTCSVHDRAPIGMLVIHIRDPEGTRLLARLVCVDCLSAETNDALVGQLKQETER